MKLGIISDTHDHLPNIQKAVKIFNKEKVELVVHCGDWCSPFVPDFFEGLKCQLKGVFGNNDADIYAMLRREKNYKVKIEFTKRILELDLGGKKAVVYHGDDAAITEALASAFKYDVVITGHTHEVVNEGSGKVLRINPGTLSHYRKGAINKKFTIAVYDSDKNSCNIITL